MVTLDKLIVERMESLVDEITMDATCQIPSFGKAPLRPTMDWPRGG